MFKVGFGFAVIVKLFGDPTQPPKDAVTEIVDTSCVATFAALNAAILPVPDANKPVFTLSFVQENVEPTGLLTKVVAETPPFAQIT